MLFALKNGFNISRYLAKKLQFQYYFGFKNGAKRQFLSITAKNWFYYSTSYLTQKSYT